MKISPALGGANPFKGPMSNSNQKDDGLDPSLLLDLDDLLSKNKDEIPEPKSSTSIPDLEIGFDWDVDKQWTVADRGERRIPGQPRYIVVPWDHVPIRTVLHPNPWQVTKGMKVKVDKSIPEVSISTGTPMTYEEASESARRMNEFLDVMES